MRPIDADALNEDLRESYNELRKIYDGLTYEEDRMICGAQLSTFLEVLMRIKEAPTLDVIPTKKIYDYLQARLDEWNALGDRKYEPANVWGYNFIRACFDDLEEYGTKMDKKEG